MSPLLAPFVALILALSVPHPVHHPAGAAELERAEAFVEQSSAIAVYAHQQIVDTFLATLVPPPPSEPVESHTGAVAVTLIPLSTGTCGGATNGADQFIARESGGDPSAMNPSGAYGCWQIMPGTWAASCSDLGDEMGSAVETQATCASRLPISAWDG